MWPYLNLPIHLDLFQMAFRFWHTACVLILAELGELKMDTLTRDYQITNGDCVEEKICLRTFHASESLKNKI
jgi:hypothetical protein